MYNTEKIKDDLGILPGVLTDTGRFNQIEASKNRNYHHVTMYVRLRVQFRA